VQGRRGGTKEQVPNQLPCQPSQPIYAAEAGTFMGVGIGEDHEASWGA